MVARALIKGRSSTLRPNSLKVSQLGSRNAWNFRLRPVCRRAALSGADWETDADLTGETRLFIRPPHSFRRVDALLTNFHLPRSTLLMLVAAFAGRRAILAAYRHAITAGYRFYSYGDAMLILPEASP